MNPAVGWFCLITRLGLDAGHCPSSVHQPRMPITVHCPPALWPPISKRHLPSCTSKEHAGSFAAPFCLSGLAAGLQGTFGVTTLGAAGREGGTEHEAHPHQGLRAEQDPTRDHPLSTFSQPPTGMCALQISRSPSTAFSHWKPHPTVCF